MLREEEKIFAGILFSPGNPELRAIKLRSHNLSQEYSAAREDEAEKRQKLAEEIMLAYGEGCFMQGPIFLHYGKHTKMGRANFFNYNLTIQDDALVTIGDHNNFGPNFTIVTPCHPMRADERRLMHNSEGEPVRLCYAKPVTIGSDCWFGAGVTVCPGVTIGDNCVIGAGSVVTRNIPSGSFAAGVPCKVIREITEKDSMKYMPEILADYQVIEE